MHETECLSGKSCRTARRSDTQLLTSLSRVTPSAVSEQYLTSPVDDLKSTYKLEMRDVSTLEDREHWAARGRISLTRRSDKALVAEYVGLAASHSWEPTSGGWWERVYGWRSA